MREQSTPNFPIVSQIAPVTLLGGADIGMGELNISLKRAPTIVAADGGADHALAAGADVAAVIGDLDSLSDRARATFAGKIHTVDESDTTDFEKCLTRISAPLILGCGFLGGRLDHTMAVLNVLIRYPETPVILLSADDVVFVAPKHLGMTLAEGTRISLLPLGVVQATSTGLRWDVDGLDMGPTAWVSSSNEVAAEQVSIDSDGPLLITLPLAQLDVAIGVVRAG